MAKLLKQSTAVTIKVGPFVDDTDGKTAKTALTLSQADFRLSKNGGDFAQKNEASSATHDELGYYDTSIDTTDTNTLGRLTVAVHEAGALPLRQDYMVVPANVYDSLVGGSDLLQVDLQQIGGSATAAFVATGTVSAYADATHVTLQTGQNIRRGHFVIASTNTGIAGMALVISYDSGTGDAEFAAPGFPEDLDNTTTYIVQVGPNLSSIATGSDDGVMVSADNVGADPLAPPAANASWIEKLDWVCAMVRNMLDNDGATQTLYADDDVTPVATFSVDDTAGVVTRGKAT